MPHGSKWRFHRAWKCTASDFQEDTSVDISCGSLWCRRHFSTRTWCNWRMPMPLLPARIWVDTEGSILFPCVPIGGIKSVAGWGFHMFLIWDDWWRWLRWRTKFWEWHTLKQFNTTRLALLFHIFPPFRICHSFFEVKDSGCQKLGTLSARLRPQILPCREVRNARHFPIVSSLNLPQFEP